MDMPRVVVMIILKQCVKTYAKLQSNAGIDQGLV